MTARRLPDPDEQPIRRPLNPEPERLAREVLRRLTRIEDRRPAHRGTVVSHVLDEIHAPSEPCDICAILAAESRPPELPPADPSLFGGYSERSPWVVLWLLLAVVVAGVVVVVWRLG